MQDTDVMIAISGRPWRFPGSQIDLDSEFEWRSDGKLRLHDSIGNVVEGIGANEPKVLGVLANTFAGGAQAEGNLAREAAGHQS